MSKGTVLYVGNFELPDKGASAHRVMNNGRLFEACDYRVVFLGIIKGESFSGVRRSKSDERIFEEAYPSSTRLWLKRLTDTGNIASVVKRFEDVRLIIMYNLPFITYKAVKKAFDGTGITVAYDCTEWTDYTEGSFFKRLYKKLDEKEIRTKLCTKCKNIIVVSKTMERQYRGCNLLLLPPLVDTEDALWRQQREKSSEGFEFCFAAGTLENKERADLMLQAFHELSIPDVRMRVIGITEEDYLKAYPGHTELLSSESRLSFMGRLSHEDTVKRVLSCDCYIFIRGNILRNHAGFPTKFVEAYTCGVPVITTDVSDVAMYMTSPEKGRILKTADDAEELKAAMESVYSNRPDTKKELDKSFDYRKYISETEEWMNRLS